MVDESKDLAPNLESFGSAIIPDKAHRDMVNAMCAKWKDRSALLESAQDRYARLDDAMNDLADEWEVNGWPDPARDLRRAIKSAEDGRSGRERLTDAAIIAGWEAKADAIEAEGGFLTDIEWGQAQQLRDCANELRSRLEIAVSEREGSK